jgi:hypothetical protein
MDEFGIVGDAEVLAIEPSRPLAEGLVTGVFRHSHTLVLELRVAGDEPFGITSGHAQPPRLVCGARAGRLRALAYLLIRHPAFRTAREKDRLCSISERHLKRRIEPVSNRP